MSVPPITGEVREYTAADGAVLKYRHYCPAGEPRAYLVGIHGIQSHSGWYEWSSARLAAAGYDVRFLDRRGSGLNAQSTAACFDAWQLCLDLVAMFAEMDFVPHASRPPVLLLSVSWGGKLAAAFESYCRDATNTMIAKGRWLRILGVLNGSEVDEERQNNANISPLAGVALLYPAIFTHFDPSIVQRGAIRTAVGLGLGRRTVAIPLDDPALFTDDPSWQQFIRDDSLTLRRVSLSFLNATLDLTAQANVYPERNPPPTFVALAGGDRIVDLKRTRDWVARLPHESTRVVEYPAARHTLEFDACREQFVADLIEWIESLVASHSS